MKVGFSELSMYLASLMIDFSSNDLCCLGFAFGAMFTLAVGASQSPAQSAHPFGQPVTSPVFSLMPVAGMVDVNRDGTSDLVVPGLFFGSLMSTLDENGRALGANASGPNMSIPAGVSMLPNMRARCWQMKWV